jgi:hypothetical protein
VPGSKASPAFHLIIMDYEWNPRFGLRVFSSYSWLSGMPAAKTSMTRRLFLQSLAVPVIVRSQPHVVEHLEVGASRLDVSFSGTEADLGHQELLHWIQRSANGVAKYYGSFPVPHASITVLVREDRQGVSGGRTWGNGGARTRIAIGQHTTAAQLDNDWVMTHEFAHYGFPDLPERNHWMEEGLATYVEPIARVAAGTQTASRAWFEMMRDMPQGLPRPGDEGLNKTNTWGRTYWGGAIFCLMADIVIRRETANRRGLRDALRGIQAAGGNIEVEWPIERAFEIGDRAVGGRPLMSLYERMAEKPMNVDLQALWKQLGVEVGPGGAKFDNAAPLAAIRRAMLS